MRSRTLLQKPRTRTFAQRTYDYPEMITFPVTLSSTLQIFFISRTLSLTYDFPNRPYTLRVQLRAVR